MAHHAYFYAGDREIGAERVRNFVIGELGAETEIIPRTYSLFSVDDARALRDIAELATPGANAKALIVSVNRIFHEAQNALLKLFEEPPKDTYLFLILPSEGVLLPTLRSRLLVVPEGKPAKEKGTTSPEHPFFAAKGPAREKIIEKILDRSKSDKDDEKQAARGEALQLAEALARAVHDAWWSLDTSSPAQAKKAESYQLFLNDLDRFIPILHERSAPLKQIFEHLMLVMPAGI